MAWVPRNGDSTGLVGMFVLAMAALCNDKIPTIRFDQFDNVSDLHLNQPFGSTIYLCRIITRR